MKISLLVPIGRFSYFVHASLQNVFETAGATLDFVFLTSQYVGPDIEVAFSDARKLYSFRVVSAPFDAGSNHLRLLDWAMREADLSEWVAVQHCDLFWRERGWLRRVLGETGPERVVVCPPYPSKYRLGSRNIPIVGDFFGAYNRRQVIDRGLFFRWGTLGREVAVSPEVAEAIRSGSICREDGRAIETGREWMDGSQAMGWEMAVHAPESIRQVDLDFLHLTGFFRIAETIHRVGSTLQCNFPLALSSYALYSHLTSFCIERAEVQEVAVPWRLFERLARLYGRDVGETKPVGEWLRGYSTARQVVGLDDLGIERVDFNGEVFSTRLVKFA